MTARIEIGRLSAKDLGKAVSIAYGGTILTGVLRSVSHYPDAMTYASVAGYGTNYPSDALIEVTGTNNKEQA